MFPSTRSRLATAARRGLGVALEFATLGEYGVAEPAFGTGAADGTARETPRRKPRAVPTVGRPAPRAAVEIRPATAAARRRNQPPPKALSPGSGSRKSVPARAALRDLGLRPSGAAAPPRHRRRMRAGEPPARPQPCLTALTTGSQHR